MTTTGTPSLDSIVRSAVAARTGMPAEELGDDVSLADVGLDSLDVIELLVAVSEQVTARSGAAPDVVGDPEGLPWLDTMGDLVDLFAPTASAVDAGEPSRGTRRCRPPLQ